MAFIQEIWSKDIQMENANYNTIEDLVTNYSEVDGNATVGDTIHVPVVSFADATDPGVGGLVTFNDGTASEVVIELTTEKNYGFSVKDIEQAQTNINLRQAHTQGAAMKLREVRDSAILALAGGLTQTVGTYGVDIDEDTILAAKLLLDKAKAPRVGRILVVSAKDENALLKIERFTEAAKYGASASAIASGEIGRIHGFTVIMSELVKQVEGESGEPNQVDNVAFVKETFGIAYSIKDRVNAQYDINYKKWKVVADTLFGVKTIRDEFGVLVKC